MSTKQKNTRNNAIPEDNPVSAFCNSEVFPIIISITPIISAKLMMTHIPHPILNINKH